MTSDLEDFMDNTLASSVTSQQLFHFLNLERKLEVVKNMYNCPGFPRDIRVYQLQTLVCELEKAQQRRNYDLIIKISAQLNHSQVRTLAHHPAYSQPVMDFILECKYDQSMGKTHSNLIEKLGWQEIFQKTIASELYLEDMSGVIPTEGA